MTTKKTVVIVVAVLASVALLITLFVAGVAGFVFYNIGTSEAAETAKKFLRANDKLKADIGEVRDFGFFVTGNINTRGGAGNAVLSLKTVGANKTVNAQVEMVYRSERDWRVVEAYYDNDAGERVYLTKNFEEDAAAAVVGPDAGESVNAEGGEGAAGGEIEGGTEGGAATAAAAGTVVFDEESFAADVLEAELPVLVVVGSPSSLDSNELEDILEQLAPKYEERVGLFRYNLSEQPVVLQRFGVETVPTLILFKGGRELERRAGKISRRELEAFIDKHLEP
jgi:thioredoxin 1